MVEPLWEAAAVATLSRADDARLRAEAMAWLTLRTNDGNDSISHEDLKDFTFAGQRVPLIDNQRGIRKPALLDAALSIRTVYRPEGADRPYDDDQGPDGLIRYKWRGDDGDHAENRALRTALRMQVPLIWFFGVGPGLYAPIYPVHLVGEEPAQQQFVLAPPGVTLRMSDDSPMEEWLRRYVIAETRRRMHQPVFRATVLRAYKTRCAICALRHSELLDAAHIVADSAEGGIAAVRNGLALCKIHHAAFDARVVGIRPDYVVQVREDILEEVDGPMLEHGLKQRHNQPLMVVPDIRKERPDPELLSVEFERFLSA